MNLKWLSLVILIVLLCNACATKTLWENTNPGKYVKIEFSKITEEELLENGVKYIKDNSNQVFYVEKNSFAKLKDYTYRILGTPMTLVIDATTIVVVAVGLSICTQLQQNGIRIQIN